MHSIRTFPSIIWNMFVLFAPRWMSSVYCTINLKRNWGTMDANVTSRRIRNRYYEAKILREKYSLSLLQFLCARKKKTQKKNLISERLSMQIIWHAKWASIWWNKQLVWKFCPRTEQWQLIFKYPRHDIKNNVFFLMRMPQTFILEIIFSNCSISLEHDNSLPRREMMEPKNIFQHLLRVPQ